jgi:hypothetical protein
VQYLESGMPLTRLNPDLFHTPLLSVSLIPAPNTDALLETALQQCPFTPVGATCSAPLDSTILV